MPRIRNRLLVRTALLGAIVQAALAQTPDGGSAPPTIATDRPAIFSICPRRLSVSGSFRARKCASPHPIITIASPDPAEESGFGDLAIGVKQQPWDAFVEYVGDFPEAGGARHVLHFGTAYKIEAKQQIDFHVGAGLSPATAHYFVGAGYSFRFSMGRR